MALDIRAHFDELIMGAYKQNEAIFVNSGQAVYLYFDSDFLACNQKFSDMLGYDNAEELMSGQWPFLQTFVTNNSQGVLSSTYQETIEKLTGSKIEVIWKKKDGSSVKTEVVMVPLVFGEHIMALHFISET